MATRTSVGSGNWGTAGTWDSGVPADGDDVVIASGHVVTFDVDQTSFTTGIGLTITGTLNHTTTTGTYCLYAKTGASIVGAGTWNIGTSGTPIPFAAKHTITGAAGWYVDGNAGLTMTVYGAEPSIKYVKLSGNEAIGQTELSVDTDVTGDIWAAGDSVYIISGYNSFETRTIAAGGITSNTITITEALTGNRVTGDYVILLSRNISFISTNNTRQIYRVGSTTNKLNINSGFFKGVNGASIDTCHYAIISGGVFHNQNYAFSTCLYGTFSGITTCGCGSTGGVIYNSSYSSFSNISIIGYYPRGIYSNAGSTFNNMFFAHGQPSRAFDAVNYVDISNSVVAKSGVSLFESHNVRISNCNFGSTTSGIDGCYYIRLHNTVISSSTEFNRYATPLISTFNTQSEDHDGVAGALKAWCKGGVVTSQTSVKPTGYVQAYLLDPESATYPVFFTKTFTVSAGEVVDVEVQLRKDASMTYLPRVYLVKSIENPLAGATPTDSFTMTDSTNTWETDTFVVDNSAGTFELEYCMYFVAQNATGNAYAAYKITPRSSGTGGGAVSIQPVSGRLGL